MKAKIDYLKKLKIFYRKNKRMPSYAELANLFGFSSKNAAKYWIDLWIEKEIISKDDAGRIVPGPSFYPVHILGTVEAGFPSPAEEENADTMSLDDWLINDKEASFMLKVSGESMIEAGIRPGDMVILERGKQPKNGDIVVAEVDHDWTIKYFQKMGKKIILKPANKNFKIIEPKEELKVAGVVTAVIRKYQ